MRNPCPFQSVDGKSCPQARYSPNQFCPTCRHNTPEEEQTMDEITTPEAAETVELSAHQKRFNEVMGKHFGNIAASYDKMLAHAGKPYMDYDGVEKLRESMHNLVNETCDKLVAVRKPGTRVVNFFGA